MIRPGLVLAGLILAGCSHTNITEMVKAWGEAQAANSRSTCVKLDLTTPWGTENGRLTSANCTNCTLTCNADGSMTVSTPVAQPTVIGNSAGNQTVIVPK